MPAPMPSGARRARSASRTAASASGAACGARSAEWDVLIKDQHEGYITWGEFERNQRVIADNATGKGSAIARGAVRRGRAAARRASALWPLRPQAACGLWRQGAAAITATARA